MNQQSRNNKNIKLENLKKITSNGFNIEDASDKSVDLAFLSLKIALEAYFSTYHCYGGHLDFRHFINDDSFKICDIYPGCNVFGGKWILSKYCEAYTECIIHFHHFAELVLKNFLRHDNPLLVDYPANEKNKDATVLKYKLIKNELSLEDENSYKTISFLDALDALSELIQAAKESKIKNDYYEKLSFIFSYKVILKQLNALRNKVWHRGLYILNYEALDEFIGRYILPFVDEVINHENYLGHKDLWSYEKLDCGIDPIKEIINHFQEVKEGESYNLEKIAFLKELGRAAYNVNIPWLQYQSLIENKAIIVTKDSYDNEICKCPVCGVNSLIIYKEEDYERDPYSGEIFRVLSSYPVHVRCECCSFELHHEIGNASEYGIEGIRDFWV